MKKFSFVAAGAAVIVLAVSGYLYVNQPGGRIDPGQKITSAPDRAFGSLASLSSAPTQNQKAEGRGAGGGAPELDAESKSMSAEIGIPGPIERIQYKYTYQGEDMKIEKDKMPVYKRQKQIGNSSLPSALSQSGLIDLSRFENTELQHITLAENKKMGYVTNLNFSEGVVSIYKNYSKWQEVGSAKCQGDTRCYEQSKLTPDDLPSDEELIKITDNFINKYGIDLTDYGRPIIDKRWQEPRRTQEKQYIPEDISIVYPKKIQGLAVYNYGGDRDGLMINVNIPAQKVSGCWNLKTNNYEASDYPIENNWQKIIAKAETGGIYPEYRQEENAKTVEITLGTPEMGYVSYQKYEAGESEELYAPALIFPVTNSPQDYNYWRKNIIVPLAQEMFNQNNDVPMPLLEKQSQ
jgi:hypothetical protein